eukprot:10958011-Lingulodinium_polyedra.AAC.1
MLRPVSARNSPFDVIVCILFGPHCRVVLSALHWLFSLVVYFAMCSRAVHEHTDCVRSRDGKSDRGGADVL